MKDFFKIAWGTTRTVYLIGSYAIKIPSTVEWRLFLLGLLANMQEWKFSACGWPELCPVVFHLPGGFLTVMKRAQPLTREEYFSINFEEWLDKPDYVVPAEIKQDSFGWLDGRLVAVDYGN